jgi:hypothetical protein
VAGFGVRRLSLPAGDTRWFRLRPIAPAARPAAASATASAPASAAD